MKALITGASSGLGRDFAHRLDELGYELILCARREERMAELSASLSRPAKIIALDLGVRENCMRLYELTKGDGVDLLINNAGFGLFGEFVETSLERELQMIDVNIGAMHILTKLFVRDFKERGSGRVLNVASAAAFMPGPLMATYYATKAYVLRLTDAVNYELVRAGSRVRLHSFCPGPVNTEFNDTAGVRFAMKGLPSEAAARYALKKMFAGKSTIVAGGAMRAGAFLTRLTPKGALLSIGYGFQRRKDGR